MMLLGTAPTYSFARGRSAEEAAFPTAEGPLKTKCDCCGGRFGLTLRRSRRNSISRKAPAGWPMTTLAMRILDPESKCPRSSDRSPSLCDLWTKPCCGRHDMAH
jgi:hypothetical protein